jgi:hypothetical protein
MDKEHGLTAFDVRNSYRANMSADLPGGNLTGAVGKILGGWSLSSSVRFNSGFPVSLTAEQARIGSAQMRFVGGSTLDLVSGGDQNPISPQNPDNYFDVSQFAFPAANCITVSTNPATPTPPQAAGCDPNSPRGAFQGNAGRNHLTVPGIGNVNLTVMKETPLGFREGTNLQFRSEFFNLLNRPNFGTPNLQVFDRTGVLRNNAGQIESTRTSAREIQFAVKLIF